MDSTLPTVYALRGKRKGKIKKGNVTASLNNTEKNAKIVNP
jgi:hypothetical protein